MEKEYISAIGRRKESVARVRVCPGEGKITVNGRKFETYFPRETNRIDVMRPIEATKMAGKYDIFANLQGGGLTGQAGAMKLGIARALLKMNEEFKSSLRQAGLLTRDPRIKERKKYGRKRARKRFQYSKR